MLWHWQLHETLSVKGIYCVFSTNMISGYDVEHITENKITKQTNKQ